jgi:hypothetical protein
MQVIISAIQRDLLGQGNAQGAFLEPQSEARLRDALVGGFEMRFWWR